MAIADCKGRCVVQRPESAVFRLPGLSFERCMHLSCREEGPGSILVRSVEEPVSYAHDDRAIMQARAGMAGTGDHGLCFSWYTFCATAS